MLHREWSASLSLWLPELLRESEGHVSNPSWNRVVLQEGGPLEPLRSLHMLGKTCARQSEAVESDRAATRGPSIKWLVPELSSILNGSSTSPRVLDIMPIGSSRSFGRPASCEGMRRLLQASHSGIAGCFVPAPELGVRGLVGSGAVVISSMAEAW